jgi:hypothetical protein
LELEGEIAHAELQLFSKKIVQKFSKIEPKLLLLNDLMNKLKKSELAAFENCRKEYLNIKLKHDAIMNSEVAFPV